MQVIAVFMLDSKPNVFHNKYALQLSFPPPGAQNSQTTERVLQHWDKS